MNDVVLLRRFPPVGALGVLASEQGPDRCPLRRQPVNVQQLLDRAMLQRTCRRRRGGQAAEEGQQRGSGPDRGHVRQGRG